MKEVKLTDSSGDNVYINFNDDRPEILIEEGVESFLFEEKHIPALEQIIQTLKGAD